jgi:hypothetical protein
MFFDSNQAKLILGNEVRRAEGAKVFHDEESLKDFYQLNFGKILYTSTVRNFDKSTVYLSKKNNKVYVGKTESYKSDIWLCVYQWLGDSYFSAAMEITQADCFRNNIPFQDVKKVYRILTNKNLENTLQYKIQEWVKDYTDEDRGFIIKSVQYDEKETIINIENYGKAYGDSWDRFETFSYTNNGACSREGGSMAFDRKYKWRHFENEKHPKASYLESAIQPLRKSGWGGILLLPWYFLTEKVTFKVYISRD